MRTFGIIGSTLLVGGLVLGGASAAAADSITKKDPVDVTVENGAVDPDYEGKVLEARKWIVNIGGKTTTVTVKFEKFHKNKLGGFDFSFYREGSESGFRQIADPLDGKPGVYVDGDKLDCKVKVAEQYNNDKLIVSAPTECILPGSQYKKSLQYLSVMGYKDGSLVWIDDAIQDKPLKRG